MSNREVRIAPSAGVFNARVIPVAAAPSGPWWRLSRTGFPSEFYPNPGSRFTPISMTFPCVYLGINYRTVVGEVFGDKFALAQETGKQIFKITIADAKTYAYKRVDQIPQPLNICNLTDPATLDRVGIDAGTIFTTNLTVTQEWAERIAGHPHHYDGIRYASRHTLEACMVLWNRPNNVRNLESEITIVYEADFIYSTAAFQAAASRGLRLAFV